MSFVSLVPCKSYEFEEVFQAVKEACAHTSFPDCKGKSILLKPNVLSDAPVKKSITTHPSIVKAMIRMVKLMGAKEVFVGDSPGLQGNHFLPKNCGIAQVCDEEGATWVDFTKDTQLKEVPYTGGLKLPFSKILDEVDIIITLPKMKTHKLMYVTGALKNQFGLIPGLNKSKCHVHKQSREDFAELIVGINTLYKPSYALMDAVIGMEGEGPANGKPRFIGYLIASDDVVALDVAEASLMGYKPTNIPIIKSALSHHLGSMPQYHGLGATKLAIADFDRIPVQKGSHLFSNLILPFLTRRLHRAVSRPAPEFDEKLCIHCKRCVQICPGAALTFTKKVEIDTKKCIRCYCCHEMCPVAAIKIQETH